MFNKSDEMFDVNRDGIWMLVKKPLSIWSIIKYFLHIPPILNEFFKEET